ncbi:hypothetical protein [Siminovitchia sp. 179-K 8D1 HS]|uniref:hypothetical protein n=1 Tax=Siminovitchia sp. 179-K 8D1 HS TaxID=3142385 RepID=UPI0039A0272A
MAVMLNQDQFGIKAQSINGLAERLSNIPWYKNAGKEDKKAEELFRRFMRNINVSEYEIVWISKEEAADTISKLRFEGSKLWEVLSVLPDTLKKKVDELEQRHLLETAVDTLPEFVFHFAFDGAFQVFQEEKAINFLTGHAMYIAILAATAEIAGEAELFAPLLDMLESGHVPLGPEGNVIYLL